MFEKRIRLWLSPNVGRTFRTILRLRGGGESLARETLDRADGGTGGLLMTDGSGSGEEDARVPSVAEKSSASVVLADPFEVSWS